MVNWAIWLPVSIIIIGFAVANRQWVDVSFDPFNSTAPFASIGMPLWAMLFCGLVLGSIAGWIICWLGQGKWRKSAREARAELRQAHQELATLRKSAETTSSLPAPIATDPF